MTIRKETLEQYGISLEETIESFQCSKCRQWANYEEWKEITHTEPLVLRYHGLKCPNCGHSHNPSDGPIRFVVTEPPTRTATETPSVETVMDADITAAINNAYLNKRGWIRCSTEFGTVECLAICIGWRFGTDPIFVLDVMPVGGFGKMTVPLLDFYSMAKLPDHSGINRIGVGRIAY